MIINRGLCVTFLVHFTLIGEPLGVKERIVRGDELLGLILNTESKCLKEKIQRLCVTFDRGDEHFGYLTIIMQINEI